jgi:hypothetical protein
MLKAVHHPVRLESEVLACLTSAVKDGLICSLLPVPYFYDEIQENQLSVYGPQNGFGNYSLYILSSKKGPPSKKAKSLIKVIARYSTERKG